jgi:cytochrome P450
MFQNPLTILDRYHQAFGDTFRFYLGGLKEAIVTIDPAVIQHVLKTNHENYQKSDIQVKRMGHFLGKGLLTTHGEPWKTQRRLIQKGFDRKQLDALSAIMQDSLADSLNTFEASIQHGAVDIYPHMMEITFSMVARSLFGARLKEEDIDLVSDTICTVQEFIVKQTLQPYLNPWFAVSGELRRHNEMRTRADAILMAYIQKRRNEMPGQDLLQTLMDARYTDGEGMSDALILSESMQLLVAGHETSSNSLSWLLYLLSSRPDVLERMRQEFDSILGDAPLSHGDVPKFEYSTQVVQESLRLYPPFWMIDRVAMGRRPRRRHSYPRRIDRDRVRLRRAPCPCSLAASGSVRRNTLHQRQRQTARTLHVLPLRRRTPRLYRAALRHAADPDDPQRVTPQI